MHIRIVLSFSNLPYQDYFLAVMYLLESEATYNHKFYINIKMFGILIYQCKFVLSYDSFFLTIFVLLFLVASL